MGKASGALRSTRGTSAAKPSAGERKRRPRMTESCERETDAVLHIFRRYAETKDLRLREDIVAQHMYLVQAVAKKFVGMGEPYEDLVQEGTMGLLNAVDMYDVERGIKFSTYATHLVTGHIRHYLRDRGRIIRQPAWVQELGGKITKTADALRHQLKREPTVEEIAARLNMEPAGVQEIMSARERVKVASLDTPTTGDDEHAAATVDVEKVRSSRHATLQLPIEDKILLQQATQKLKEMERKVVRYFFYHDLNQTEIARRMGISVNYASYLLRGAIAKLRATFESQSRLPESAAESYQRATPEPALGVVDPVTGLACAPYFDERVRQEIERASRYPQNFAVLVVQAPEGAARPQVAAPLADLLRRSVRQVDVVVRYGHASFALLLPHTGREAKVLGERLVAAIPKAAETWEAVRDADFRVSAGYAIYPSDGRTVAQLMESARHAAEQAHRSGGDAVARGSAHSRRA